MARVLQALIQDEFDDSNRRRSLGCRNMGRRRGKRFINTLGIGMNQKQQAGLKGKRLPCRLLMSVILLGRFKNRDPWKVWGNVAEIRAIYVSVPSTTETHNRPFCIHKYVFLNALPLQRVELIYCILTSFH